MNNCRKAEILGNHLSTQKAFSNVIRAFLAGRLKVLGNSLMPVYYFHGLLWRICSLDTEPRNRTVFNDCF